VSEPKSFVHLHNHSEYSLLDGASRIESQWIRLYPWACPLWRLRITEICSAPSVLQHGEKKGLKPILGCEIYVAKESRHKKTGGGDQSNHLVLLAENLDGYHNLSRLVSYGYLEGFYYRPRIDKELLSRYSGGLIALSACLKGAVPQKLLMEQQDSALEEAQALRDIFGPDNFYLELQDHNLAAQRQVNPRIVEMSRKTGIPLVCTNDSHYLRQEDSVAHDVLLCIGTVKTVSQSDRMAYETDQFYFKSPEEMNSLWGVIPRRSRTPLDREPYNLEIETKQPPPLRCPPDSRRTAISKKSSVRFSQGALISRRCAPPAPQISLCRPEERLASEIEMIKQMSFSSYFLIVWDLIKYARDHSIPVGPGRGSVVGSLVAYSLRITDIDPLQYELFFERFLNPERIEPPDIDMDFCMNRRAEVIEYVAKKYGRDNVCQIITFGTMAAKGVIRDVGRTLDIPYSDVDRIAKLIPDELNATIDKALEQEPRLREEMKDPQIVKLIEIARRLEGLSRHSSTHAAGVVIAPKPGGTGPAAEIQ
jgi:DNA polymerase-3 subunit alpha